MNKTTKAGHRYTEVEALRHAAQLLEEQNTLWRNTPFGWAPRWLRERADRVKREEGE